MVLQTAALILILAIFPQSRAAKQSANTEIESPSKLGIHQRHSTFSFTLTEANNILVAATIDDKHAVKLMLHTGVDSVSLTKEAVARLKGVKLDKSASVSSWGGKTNSRFSDNHSLKIGDKVYKPLTISESDLSGPVSDGKFGFNLLAKQVVKIDFDSKEIQLHATLPPETATYQKLTLTVKDDLMFIEGTLRIGETNYLNKFMIHSGFGGTLLLDDAFVSKNKLADQLKTISEKNLKDSYGNVIKTRNALVPSVTFGGSNLTNVPIGLFDASLGRQKFSVLGGGILKRFNIIVDWKNSQIYMKPNRHFGDKF